MTSPSATPKPSGARRARAILVWVLLAAAYTVFATAYLLPDLDHAAARWQHLTLAAFMVRTFTFHAGLLILGLCLYCVCFRLRRHAALCLPLLGVSVLPPLVHIPSPPPAQGTDLTVLSANLLYSNTDTAAILSAISGTNPDVMLFQEYSPTHHQVLSTTLAQTYPYFTHAIRDDAFGMAIYSKFPFAVQPLLYPPASLSTGRTTGVVGLSDPQIRATILVDGREVVLQSVHTVPPISGTYLAEQRRLVHWLADFAASETRPLIMAGDFNATPESASTAWLRAAGLADAHARAGRGRGCTWPALGPLRYVPGIRIDHLFTKGGARCTDIHVGPPTGSDHLPIIARIRLAP